MKFNKIFCVGRLNANRVSCFVNAETSLLKMASHRLTVRDNSQLSHHYVEFSVFSKQIESTKQ